MTSRQRHSDLTLEQSTRLSARNKTPGHCSRQIHVPAPCVSRSSHEKTYCKTITKKRPVTDCIRVSLSGALVGALVGAWAAQVTWSANFPRPPRLPSSKPSPCHARHHSSLIERIIIAREDSTTVDTGFVPFQLWPCPSPHPALLVLAVVRCWFPPSSSNWLDSVDISGTNHCPPRTSHIQLPAKRVRVCLSLLESTFPLDDTPRGSVPGGSACFVCLQLFC